ncbi:MAG: hypothetical protein AAF291_16685 [Pseudomonadota bacterium]
MPELSENYQRIPEMKEEIREFVVSKLSGFDVSDILGTEAICERLFVQMLEGGALDYQDRPIVGKYVKFDRGFYGNFRKTALDSNEIYNSFKEIGERFFEDAFDAIRDDPDLGSEPFNNDNGGGGDESTTSIPASDRLVTVSHNQSEELEKEIDKVLCEVEAFNSVDGEDGLREAVIGQLKAGRELIRAGWFKVYTLEVTLLSALRFLAERYEKEAVGALAAGLIAALIKHFGLS